MFRKARKEGICRRRRRGRGVSSTAEPNPQPIFSQSSNSISFATHRFFSFIPAKKNPYSFQPSSNTFNITQTSTSTFPSLIANSIQYPFYFPMLIPRFPSSPILNNSFFRSTLAATHVASFHSTPVSSDKWKSKWKFDAGRKGKEPSKNYVRYITRQRRADAKKALKDLLYNNGSIFQNKESKWSHGGGWSSEESFDQPGNCDKKGRAKSSTQSYGKFQHRRTKRNFRRESFGNDFDNDSETVFHVRFGNRSYTWSFGSFKESSQSSFEESSQNSESGFKWTEPPNWKNRRATEWDNSSDCEPDEETASVGSCSDRTLLGLPKSGPLKIEEVKTAFRLSALKWHPDKHQGSSQAMAEEKFKLCVNAYKSLCCALSPG